MNRLKLTIALGLGALTANAANIDYHALLPNFFTTNGYYVGLNTNAGSSLYTFTTNIAQGGGVSVAVNTNLTAVTNGSLVTLSGLAQVWTNDNAVLKLVPAMNFARVRLTNSFRITGADGDTRYSDIGQADILVADNNYSSLVEMYGYQRGTGPTATGDGVGFFQMFLDAAGYGGTVVMDPADDNGLPQPFLFSTTYSNSIGSTDKLFAIANSHTNKFVVMGNGDLYWGSDATIGWRPPPTNGTAGQVLQTDGGAPQQLSWTTVSGGPASPQIWITNVPEGGIMWSNLNGNAKFGPALTGTFVSGYTNGGTISVGNGAGHGEGSSALGYSISGGTIHAGTDNISGGALAFGYATTDGQIQSAYRGTLAFGEAIGASSLIYSDSEGSFSGGAATAGGVIQNVGTAGLFTFGYATDSGSMIDNEAAGSLAGGHVDTGGLIKVFGGADSSFIWGRASGVGAILETKGAASFLFGEADTGAVMDNEGPGTFMFGYSEATNSIIQDFGSGDLVGGLANHGGTISGGVDVAGTISGAVGSFVFGNADSGKISDNGNGNTVGGYAAGGGKVRNGAAFGTFTWGSASQTNSFIENFANGSAVVGSVLSNSSISIGVSNPTGPQSGNGVFATAEQGGLVRMNPAVGSFISGVASGTNLLSANGTNTVTFGQNVGNSGNYAYSFGLNYTNTQDRSLNVGWSSAPSVTVWTNKIVLATDEGGSGVAERFHCSGAVVTLTSSSAVKFANISLPTNGTLGLTISVWTKATGGSSDIQSVKETFAVAAINKTGTITSSVSASTPVATITSAGTLTTAFTAVINGNGLDLKETATTSLSSPTVICGWRMDIDSDYQPTVTQ